MKRVLVLTFRLPSAMSLRRLQSLQNALVMEVMKETLPLKPGKEKFFATSPFGSCKEYTSHVQTSLLQEVDQFVLSAKNVQP